MVDWVAISPLLHHSHPLLDGWNLAASDAGLFSPPSRNLSGTVASPSSEPVISRLPFGGKGYSTLKIVLAGGTALTTALAWHPGSILPIIR